MTVGIIIIIIILIIIIVIIIIMYSCYITLVSDFLPM
jgi:hypothetical protein